MANRASSSIQPSGFWLAQVVSIDTEKHISVKIPKLGGESVYEEVRFTGLTPDVGDYVWVSFIEGTPGSIIAFVGENDTSGPPSEADITEVIAGLGLSGGGDSGSVTIDFEPSELTTVDLTYDDKVVISDDSDSGEPKLVPMSDIVTVVHGDGGGEPIGHANKADSVISFDYSTRVFTIAPVGDSYEVWCKGKKYVKTSSETVTIGSTSDLYYISFDADGVLQAKTSYFVWDSETPTAYIYYNSGEPSKYMLFDERHGIVLDWQTHEYLHRTRGAAFASGFEASNFDVTTQNGNTDAQAQIDISGGTFFDEDLQVDIVHSNTPTANTWEQDLQGPAQIPVFYHSGTTGWTYDTPTNFPLKYSGTPAKPTYNLNSGGTWTTPQITSNNYGISWIVATNQLNYPVIAIMGQDFYTNIGEAEAVSWDSMNLDDLPVVELRVLYKVIYRQFGSNTPGCYFEQVDDYRNALSSATSTAAAVVDHGNLTGLGDDDHTQYLLANGTRTATELTVSGDLTVDTDTLHVDSTNDRVGVGTTTPAVDLQISKIGTGSSEPTVRLENLNGNQLDMKVNASEAYVGTPSIIPLNLGTQGQDFVTIGTTGNVSIGNDLTVDTTTLHVDSTNNRVGIGTTSPSTALQVSGTVTATDLFITDQSSFNVDVTDATYVRIGNTSASADEFEMVSLGSMDFVIDSNNNSTGKTFQWITNGGKGNGTVLMALSDTGELTVDGNTVWHAGNDGAGSGLDADLLDGVHASGFVSTTNNSSLNSDTRNTRGPTRLYRRDNNSDYSVQTYWTGARWRLYGYVGDSGHADTHVGYADSAGNADTTDGLHVHGGRNNEANKIVRTDGNGYIQAGWINTTSGATTSSIARIYASNDAYVRYVTPATFRSQIIDGQTIYPAAVDTDYLVTVKSTTSSAYQNQALQVFNPTNSTNSVAGLTFHIANQLAPVFRSWPGTGAGFDAGNQQGTGYTFLGASSFPVRSSERLKKNIHQKPDEEVIPSILNALSARTVVFDDNYTDGYWCEEEGCFKEHELCDCEDCEDCNAVRNDPLQRKHFNRRGMIAEELHEVFPEAVHLDIDGIPIGIDYAVLTVELLDAVKLLVLQCENQERRIIELESQQNPS